MSIIYRTASCDLFGDWAYKNKYNISKSNLTKVKAGDLVMFDFNGNGTSDHIGVVTRVVNSTTIETIEGNTSITSNDNGGCVMRRTRYKSQINYFVRPPYTKDVTADKILALADSQVGIKENPSGSNKVKYNTWYYGKTVSGAKYPWCMVYVEWLFAHANEEPKPIVPHEIEEDGEWGYETSLLSQQMMNKYDKAGLAEDGDAGKNTWKAIQKHVGLTGKNVDGVPKTKTWTAIQNFLKARGLYDAKVDGIKGAKSIKGWQKYLNSCVKGSPIQPKPSEPTKAQKIVNTAKILCHPYGTAEKKWKYDTGAPLSVYKTALNKYMQKTAKVSQSDCGYFVSTVVRYAGIDSTFLALKDVKDAFPTSAKFSIVHKGSKIPSGTLKAGDIIRYKKTNGTSQHTLIYIGDGLIAEAGRKTRFPVIRKSTKYNNSDVKFSTLQVLRTK